MAKETVEAPKVIGAKEYGKGESQAKQSKLVQDEGVVAKPFKTVKEKIAK